MKSPWLTAWMIDGFCQGWMRPSRRPELHGPPLPESMRDVFGLPKPILFEPKPIARKPRHLTAPGPQHRNFIGPTLGRAPKSYRVRIWRLNHRKEWRQWHNEYCRKWRAERRIKLKEAA